MCFGQYFNMWMETFYQNKVFLLKFFIKFYWNQCVSVNILICTCKNSIKTLCFGRKKNSKNCALIKSVSVTFYNSSTKTNVFQSVFEYVQGYILPKHFVLLGKTARNVLDQKHFCYIFKKFHWNKCVSVSILICARIILPKHFVLIEKKQQELCLIKSVSLTFS